MITTIRRRLTAFAIPLVFFAINSSAQELRTFNQNASRSNHTRLSFSFSPVYSTAVNTSSDSLLFRGSGGGLRFGADYFFGMAGISISSGFGSSSADDANINNFLKNIPIPQDQLTITKSKQQNMYLLLGPSLQVGNKVQLYAHAKGGLFINNGGLVNIQQKGAQRAVYRNESTSKSIYPGFQTGISFQYKGRSDIWSFGIGADYMSTKTEMTNYDIRRGNGIEGMKLSRNISDVVAGITVRYNISSPRDHASGQSTGRRVLPTVNKREIRSPRDVASGMPTGKRTYQPGQPVYGNITRQDGETIDESCGPVTKTVTHPDGTTEEMTFSCPEDAAAYSERTADVTQQATWSSSNPARTISNADGAKGIISGRLTWPSTGNTGIITNAIISSNTPRSGSTTLNSQTSSTRTTQNTSFGSMVRMSARDAASGQASGKRSSRDAASGLATGKRSSRDAASGQATGKRSSRDAASGLATGRRQYEPVFVEGSGEVCNPCLVTVKNNPLYQDNGMSGTNPLAKSVTRDADEDCDGIAGMDVSLIDRNNGSVVAKTRTEQCGDFFFANVPEGDYVVRVSGSFLSKKGYDTYLKSKTDLLGSVETMDQPVQLLINTGDGEGDGMQQKAGISTSRSNIRTKSLAIIEADLDGDGEYESLRAIATFSDGSSQDVTSSARVSNTAGSKGIVLEAGAMNMSRRRVEVLKSNKQGTSGVNKISAITIKNTGSNLTATGTFSDGSSRDITESLETNTNHAGVKQYTITVSDSDDDGIADAVIKTKTKSNQSNDRLATGDLDGDGIWSPRSNVKLLNIATGDVNGDGVADLSVGAPFVPGGSVITAAMRPGNPIGGLIIKGGKNPGGGNSRTTQTDENGEFEFTNLDEGDYTFTVEQMIFIDDETLVSTRAQDHNSSRSNKSASTQSTLDLQDDGRMISESEAKNGVALRWTPVVPKPAGSVTYRLRVWQLMQGQNGTQAMRSNKPVADKSVTDVTETSVQGILTGPCKPPYLCDFIWSVQAISNGKLISNGNDNKSSAFSVGQSDNDDAVNKAQDHNSSRSNKTASSIATDPDNGNETNAKTKDTPMPIKWSAPESTRRIINTTRDNIKRMLATLDDLEEQVDADASNEKASINTTRSNIKRNRLAAYDLRETMDNMEYMDKQKAMDELNDKITVANNQITELQSALKQMGSQYSSISNVLKTRHDTVKNSIGNIR